MNRIYRAAWVGLLVAVLSACSPKPAQGPKGDGIPVPAVPASGAPLRDQAPAKDQDIGDIETALRIAASVAETSRAPSVAVDEMRDQQNRINLATVTVTPPAPKELWISFQVALIRKTVGGPAVLRAKILRDNVPIGSFALVVGADLLAKPYEHRVDVLSGLTMVPKTLLVVAEGEVILLPRDANPSTIDARTVPGTPDTTGSVLSNPVRINFGSGGDAP